MEKDKEIPNPDETFTMTKEDLANTIKLTLETFAKESGITKVAEVGIEAKKVLEKEHPGFAFHKAMVDVKNGNGAEYRQKAMTEGTAADGGYLVPAITEPRIIELIKTSGQARQLMTVIPMAGNVMTIPKELVKPTVTWVGEASAISESNPTLQTITLTPKKAAVISAISNELMADANPDIGNYVMRAMAESYAIAEDVAIFGVGTSPFTALFRIANSWGAVVQQVGGATVPVPTYALLVDMLVAIDQAKLSGARWLMSRPIFGLVKKIVDGQSLPIFSPASEHIPATILGYPVEIIEKAPSAAGVASKVYIIFGNPQNSIIGDVGGLTFAVSNSAYVGSSSGFELDLTHIRLTKRTAYDNVMLEDYVAIKSAAS